MLLSAAAAAIVAVLLAVGGDGVPGPAPTSQGGPAAAPVDPGPAAAPRDLPEPIRLEPGSVGLVDPSTGRIIAGIELPSRPGDIAVDGDSVWITSPDPDNVLRLDRESRAVVDAIPVGVDPVGVAVGEGSVWVVQAGGPSLLRISPETGTVVQTIEIGAGPVDVTVAHGAVWTANRLDDTVQRFDPATGDTATIPVGDAPAAIAASGDAVWVACAGAGAVYRIDPATNTVIATTAVGNGPSSIAVAGEDVWVGNGLDRTVSVVDAAGSTVSSTIPIDDAPAAIAADSGDVWVAGDETGTLVRLDPVDRSVGRTVRLGNAPQGLALAGGELWVGVRGAATSHGDGTLRLVADGMLQSVDPGVTDDWWAWAILSATNDGLVDYRRVGGSGGAVLVPNLAVNLPSPTDGGTTYRFQLRSGIRYSTGEPVRAGDVRRALERAISLAGGLTYLFEGIRGAGTCTRAACDLSAGVVADDEAGTITFHLTEPDPEFLHKLTMTPAYPVPEGVAGPGSVPATGPYAIEEFVPGQAGGRLTLVRNPHFRPWSLAAQPEGNPDRIQLTVAPTEDAAIAAVMDGRADLLATSSPPRDRLLELATTHAGQLHVSSLGNVWFMTLNTRVPPFDDVRVRRALNYAIDRSAIVEFFGGPAFAKPTCQILPPSLSGYEPHCPYTASPAAAAGGAWSAPDLEKARALVRASGTAGAPVRVWTTDQFPAGVAVGREVVSVLEQLGYRARLRIVRHDPSDYFGQILDSRTEAQVALSGWITQYLSPFEFIASQLTCRAFIPASPENGNVSGFCDPAVDAAIERGAELELSNPELAADQWAAVDRMIVDQAPYAPLVNEVWLDLTSSRVGNYQFHPHWGPLLDQLWVR